MCGPLFESISLALTQICGKRQKKLILLKLFLIILVLGKICTVNVLLLGIEGKRKPNIVSGVFVLFWFYFGFC